MKLIKPRLISGEIMNLFEDAEKTVIVVSPYYKITRWHKLLKCLYELDPKKITIEFYVRENEWESIEDLHRNGIVPVAVPNLHTKLYLNEKQAIISSMNLSISSDTNSLDIAMKTETEEEYQGLFAYYKQYIQKYSVTNNRTTAYNNTEVSASNTRKAATISAEVIANNTETKTENFSRAQLDFLGDEIVNLFPWVRVGPASTYLFITKLLPDIALFIRLNEIVIKYTRKNPAPIDLQNLVDSIKSKFIKYDVESVVSRLN